jgi:hypothetical protein
VTTTLEDEGVKGALGVEKVLKFQDRCSACSGRPRVRRGGRRR